MFVAKGQTDIASMCMYLKASVLQFGVHEKFPLWDSTLIFEVFWYSTSSSSLKERFNPDRNPGAASLVLLALSNHISLTSDKDSVMIHCKTILLIKD